MLKIPEDRYSRIVISVRILLPAIALAGVLAPFVLTPEPSHGEKIVAAENSKFASLKGSKFGAVTEEGFVVLVETESTEWKGGAAQSESVVGKAVGPNGMEVTIRAGNVRRADSSATVHFDGGAKITTNFGYSLVSQGFEMSVKELDFSSTEEVFLTFPAGFGAVGHLDFVPAAKNYEEAKYPGSLSLENDVIIVFNLPDS